MSVRVGDGPAWRLEVPSGQWRTFHVPVPPEQLGSERVVVFLSAPTFVPALERDGSSDARALSLMVSEVSLR